MRLPAGSLHQLLRRRAAWTLQQVEDLRGFDAAVDVGLRRPLGYILGWAGLLPRVGAQRATGAVVVGLGVSIAMLVRVVVRRAGPAAEAGPLSRAADWAVAAGLREIREYFKGEIIHGKDLDVIQ
jgi:hypothetical protein